jgi:peptidoglycan/LPS O-acetylase OafA/YrhL
MITGWLAITVARVCYPSIARLYGKPSQHWRRSYYSVDARLEFLGEILMTIRLNYRTDLDGLRAIAVIPVILYHLGVNVFPGGFVGVDVFFVLSGYLITGVIAADLARGEFSLSRFYDRRIRRIAPALILVLFISTIAAAPILFPIDLVNFGSALIATAFSVSNFYFVYQSDYFSPNAEKSPLLHTWSLSIEEQFYLLFPCLLSLIWRRAGQCLPQFIWLGFLASLALSIWGTWAYPRQTFYLLPTRAWELLIGSILALKLVPQPVRLWHREASALVGILVIFTSMTVLTRETPFPGTAAMFPCLGTALVIWAGLGNDNQTLISRMLGCRIFVFIGTISYGLYLWHWPLIVFAKHLTNGKLTLPLQFTLALVTFALSILSWQYVESPLRTSGKFWPAPRHRFLSTALALLTLVLLGASVKTMNGFPERMGPIVADLAAKSHDFALHRNRCHADGLSKPMFDQTCVFGSPVVPMLVVFGDSHGADLSVALGEAAELRKQSVRQLTTSNCPPVVGFVSKIRPDCGKHVTAILSNLADAAPSTIILTADYFSYAASRSNTRLWDGLAATVASLQLAGHTVLLLGAMPPHPFRESVPLVLARRAYFGGIPEDYRFSFDQKLASEIEFNIKRISKAAGAVYVPLVPYFCPDKHGCLGYIGQTVIYFDDNHLTLSAARQLVDTLLSAIIWPK